MDRVVLDSWHMFVYYDDECIESLRKLANEYIPKINSSEPIVIYVKDSGLPKIDTSLELDSFRITIFHERYYELLIFLSIIDRLISYIDNNELNNRLSRTFKIFSQLSKREIKDINILRSLLIDSKNMFRDGYIEYINTGKIDFYEKVPIPFIMIDNMIPQIKKEIGLQRHFSLMLELQGDVSKYNNRSINDYIASRCTGYLSMNVLLRDDKDWKNWFSNNGQFIQDVHDYSVVDFRRCKIRQK